MRDERIVALSLRLLEPYTIAEDCPYLSEDQRELARLTLPEREAWMAEWLVAASACGRDEEDEEELEGSEPPSVRRGPRLPPPDPPARLRAKGARGA